MKDVGEFAPVRQVWLIKAFTLLPKKEGSTTTTAATAQKVSLGRDRHQFEDIIDHLIHQPTGVPHHRPSSCRRADVYGPGAIYALCGAGLRHDLQIKGLSTSQPRLARSSIVIHLPLTGRSSAAVLDQPISSGICGVVAK